MSSVPRTGIILGVAAFMFWPLVLVLLVVIGQAADCQPASAVSGGVATAGGPPTIVGDSITDMSRAALLAKFPGAPIIAKGGMDWQWGIDHLPKPAHPTLAFLMGTNAQKRGTPQVTETDLRALVTAAPGVRDLILMTNRMPNIPLYSYQTANNRLFHGAQSAVDSQTATLKRLRIAVHVVDWAAQSAAHPTWMGPDGIHPTAEGSKAIATLISQAIPVAKVAAAKPAAAAARPAAGKSWPPVKEGSIHYTQAQMTAAVRKYDPQQAVALGAIAMAESGGTLFPHNNSTGQYHSPWAMQAAWAGALYDLNRLDGDLDYAAQAVAKLASTGITHQRWETWPTAAAKFMGGAAGSGAAAAVPVAQIGPVGSVSNDCPAQAAFASGPGGTASADGWTFPLKTTQSALRKGSVPAGGGPPVPWCYTSQTNCHHDYNAADLMVPTGTVAIAPMAGTVVSAHQGKGSTNCIHENRGDNFSWKSDAGGMAFFEGHLLTGSLQVHVGQHFTAGQAFGQVGTAAEAQCTLPHLHIQENPPGDYGGQGPEAINLQPVLTKLFTKLPA